MERDGTGPRWQFRLGRENGLVAWAMFFLEGSFTSYFLLLPLYVAQLGANPTQVGLVIGAWGFMRLVLLLPSGLLVDRLPPVRLIIAMRAMSILGLLVAAVIPVWWLLPVALLFMACGNVAFPAISAVIAGASDEEGRARAFTINYTVVPAIATIIAPAVSGALAEATSLRASLLLAAALSTVSVVIISRLTPQPPPSRDEAPASYRETLAFRPIRTICLLQLVTLLILTTGTTLVPNFLHDVHGVEFSQIGQLGSIAAIGSVLLGLLFGRLRPFKQPLLGITVATALSASASAMLLIADGMSLFALAFLLRGGYMVAWSLFVAALGNLAPPRLYGRAFALSEICAVLGLAVAPFLAGPLYDWRPTAPLIVALIGSLPLVGLLALFTYRARRAESLGQQASDGLLEPAGSGR